MVTSGNSKGAPADREPFQIHTRPVTEILLLAAVLAFLVLGDAPDHTRLWNALFDAGHAPLFGVVALLVGSLVSRADRTAGAWRASGAAFVVTMGIAVAGEALQLFQANREVSLADLLRDAAGAGAFLLVRAATAARRETDVTARRRSTAAIRARAARGVAIAAAVVMLGAATAELVATTGVYIARSRAFPTLFALDGSWWERRLIATGRNTLEPGRLPGGAVVAPAAPFARLSLEPGFYSGLTFDEPYPDWRGYRRLVFTVVSDLDEPLLVTIRVHDAAHDQRFADRFNRRLVIKPGSNRIVIPLDDIRRAPDRREMDLRRIRGIVLFAYRLQRPTRVYLGPLRLE